MQLLLIRHAIAEDRDIFGKTGLPDEQRPLTAMGEDKMLKAARGLAYLLPDVDALVSSPLTRAVQTADILAEIYPLAQREQLAVLSPGSSPQLLLDWLGEQEQKQTLVLIGHEPELGMLAAYLLTGQVFDFMPMKKGSAALLHFKNPPRAGGAQLRWSLTPRQLRALRHALK